MSLGFGIGLGIVIMIVLVCYGIWKMRPKQKTKIKTRKTPRWNLSQGSSDFQLFVKFMFSNFSNWEYYKLNLVNVPLEGEYKPAMVLKVQNEEYRTWTQAVNIEGVRWSYVTEENYVVLVLEAWFAAPEGRIIGMDRSPGKIIVTDNKNRNKMLFRQYFDPADPYTETLINSWVGLEGNDVIFFVTDGSMNYLSGPTPKKYEAAQMLQESKNALAALQNKGTFKPASVSLMKKLPLQQRYSVMGETEAKIENRPDRAAGGNETQNTTMNWKRLIETIHNSAKTNNDTEVLGLQQKYKAQMAFWAIFINRFKNDSAFYPLPFEYNDSVIEAAKNYQNGKKKIKYPMVAALQKDLVTYKPKYFMTGGQIGRETNAVGNYDMLLVQSCSYLKGRAVSKNNLTPLALEAIGHFVRIPIVSYFFALPSLTAGSFSASPNDINQMEISIYTGTESILLEIYGELENGGVITDELAVKKIEALFKGVKV